MTYSDTEPVMPISLAFVRAGRVTSWSLVDIEI